MLSKNTIKFIQSLKIKKYRQIHNSFIVEGEKSVAELLNTDFTIQMVYGLESWLNQFTKILVSKRTPFTVITPEELSKISDLTTPNQVLAIVSIPPAFELTTDYYSDLVLALDGIRDPGNMGTIIRTADWFGIKNIACSTDCVDLYNTKTIQSTMGSYARVNVLYIDLKSLILKAPDSTPVYGALLEGPLLTDKKFTKPGILIIGNESNGISTQLIPLISDPVFIPPFPFSGTTSYHAESLNASMANAIICYEIRKQLSENKF